jgi:hypothetical protein
VRALRAYGMSVSTAIIRISGVMGALVKLRKQQRKAAVRIQVINGVLARQHFKDGSDAGFAPLVAGTYEVTSPAKEGQLEVKKDAEHSVFMPLDKLENYVKQGDIQKIM